MNNNKKKSTKTNYQKTLVNGELMYCSVVYVYKLKLTGQCYVGVSAFEQNRRYSWSSIKNSYSGYKINAARKKYGISPNVWDYSVIEIIQEKELNEFLKRMDERESYWIAFYDSYYNGFNGNKGGRGRKGIGHTKTQTDAIIQASIKPVKVIMNGETKIYSRSMDAAKDLNISLSMVSYYKNSGKSHHTLGFKIEAV